jgi:hypothetical protein
MGNYLIELGGVKNGKFRRNIYTEIDDNFDDTIIEFLDESNNTDVYYSIFTYADEDIENCLLHGPLYFDLDYDIENERDFNKIVKDTLITASYLEQCFGIPEKMVQIYFSGSKGFHILVEPEVFGIEPRQNLNEQYKTIASELNKQTIYKTIDVRIYDRRRLFRFPNSINAKTGLHKVPIRQKDLRGITLKKIQEYASEPREIEWMEPAFIEKAKSEFERILLIHRLRESKRKNKNSKVKLPIEKRELLPCVNNILEEGVAKGSRNNTSVALASSLYQSGFDQEEVISTLLAWNERNNPPLRESEVYTTARSAYSLVMSGKGYGCTFFKDHDLCIGQKCPVFNR